MSAGIGAVSNEAASGGFCELGFGGNRNQQPKGCGAGEAADGARSSGSDSGACGSAVAKGDCRHLQGRQSGYASYRNRRDDDGDDGRAAARGRERAEFRHHARADFLQPPGRTGRNGGERSRVERETRIHREAWNGGVEISRSLAHEKTRRNSGGNGPRYGLGKISAGRKSVFVYGAGDYVGSACDGSREEAWVASVAGSGTAGDEGDTDRVQPRLGRICARDACAGDGQRRGAFGGRDAGMGDSGVRGRCRIRRKKEGLDRNWAYSFGAGGDGRVRALA